MRPPRCPLCGTRSAEVRPVGAVALCERCASGWALHAADERGWTVREERAGGRLKITLETGRPTGLEARLVPEATRHKAIKLLVSEVEAGDRAFDDAIYITTGTRRQMKAWIERPEVRETLRAVVHGNRSIAISAGDLVFEDVDRPDLDISQARADAAAVALVLPSDG